MPYSRLHLIACLLALLWLLTACGPMTIRDEQTRSYIPIQGWVLELHRDVSIPPGRARVFLQEGRLLHGVNEYKPHCHINVRDISEQAQGVHAGRFSIEKVYGRVGEVVMNDRIQHVAGPAAGLIADGGNGNGEGLKIYSYFMKLHSGDQPWVTYLACGGGADMPALAEYPTLQDIETALGDYATLIRPQGG